jgi:hypothetical protein
MNLLKDINQTKHTKKKKKKASRAKAKILKSKSKEAHRPVGVADPRRLRYRSMPSSKFRSSRRPTPGSLERGQTREKIKKIPRRVGR